MTTKTWGARALAVTATLGLVLAIGTVNAGAGSFVGAITVNPTAVAPGEDFMVSGGADCDETTLTIEVIGLDLVRGRRRHLPLGGHLHRAERRRTRHLHGHGGR